RADERLAEGLLPRSGVDEHPERLPLERRLLARRRRTPAESREQEAGGRGAAERERAAAGELRARSGAAVLDPVAIVLLLRRVLLHGFIPLQVCVLELEVESDAEKWLRGTKATGRTQPALPSRSFMGMATNRKPLGRGSAPRLVSF